MTGLSCFLGGGGGGGTVSSSSESKSRSTFASLDGDRYRWKFDSDLMRCNGPSDVVDDLDGCRDNTGVVASSGRVVATSSSAVTSISIGWHLRSTCERDRTSSPFVIANPPPPARLCLRLDDGVLRAVWNISAIDEDDTDRDS